MSPCVIEGAPVLAPHALLAVADAVATHPGTRMVYSDSDRIDATGRRHAPSFRPAWNPDLFLSRDYIGGTAMFATGLVRAIGGFRADHAPAMSADMALRCLGAGDLAPVHLPLVLSHWPDAAGIDHAGIAAARLGALREHLGERALEVMPVGDGARVRWPLPGPPPRVSIVVPTRDRADLLRQCVESILSLSTYPDIELLVVDNGSVEADAVRQLPTAFLFEPGRLGAMALFGEKYGEHVRVITFDPNWSVELCGGTHARATGEIGLLRFLSEGSVAAGVRRVEAVVGEDALETLYREVDALERVRGQFKGLQRPVEEEIGELIARNRQLQAEMEQLRAQRLESGLDAFISRSVEVGGVRVITGRVEPVEMDTLRNLGQSLRDRLPAQSVGVLGTVDPAGEKVYLVAVVTDDLLSEKKLQAGKIVGVLARHVGGGGGGRPALATAGGRDAGKLDEALAATADVVREMAA